MAACSLGFFDFYIYCIFNNLMLLYKMYFYVKVGVMLENYKISCRSYSLHLYHADGGLQ